MKNSKTKLTSKRRKQSLGRGAVPHKPLAERKVHTRRFVQFSQIKGRTLDKLEFYTAPDYHSITLFFQDKTSLTLVIEPCFLMAASLADRSSGEQRILKRWPMVRSATEKS